MELLITPNIHYFCFFSSGIAKNILSVYFLGILKKQLQNSTLITSLHICKLRHCTERQIEGYFIEASACTLKKSQAHEKAKTCLKGLPSPPKVYLQWRVSYKRRFQDSWQNLNMVSGLEQEYCINIKLILITELWLYKIMSLILVNTH